ncbi:MAG TPA: S41 family peptidase [Ideonella sp.]|uniref:S41 family peptidase n=1 Tax=Ideonella sp. TaxID=1929293 RepID=UPI002D1B11F1|nr:S41 family peptidase [Ideonella sp.]HSI48400.1 S41 family peptidase [Ideonella sp.]
MKTGTKKRVAGAAMLLAAVGAGLAWQLGMAQSGPPQKDMPLDASMRREVITQLNAQMQRHYVDEAKARQLAQALQTRLQQGDFDRITSAQKLAETLTEAMQQQLHDKHLEMRYFEQAIPEDTGQDETQEDQARDFIRSQRLNFGFAEVRRLRGNIGYLDLHQFGRPQFVAERIAAAMTLLADTQALVIDLRRNGGGDPESVMLLASYLFDQPTHLNDIVWPRENNRTEARWTTAKVPGKRYGQSRPVYLLTSEDTFSAGEDFAMALKDTGRATLVGEVTGGGAHPGDRRRLTAHFMMNVPTGLSVSPVTHTDWEGVGVKPDIEVSEKKALDLAQVEILKRLIAAEKDAEWRRRLQQQLAELD